jgi:hypothetical protein
MSGIDEILNELSEDSQIYAEETPVASEFKREVLREKKLSNDLISEDLDNKKNRTEHREKNIPIRYLCFCAFFCFLSD